MSDTIAAISTPPGEGGIGIVRISGDRASGIMRQIFRPCPDPVVPRHVYYGTVVRHEARSDREEVCDKTNDHPSVGGCAEGPDTPREESISEPMDTVIDEAVCFYMKAPHSYTGEDVVEIQAHGGIVSIRTILRCVLEAGARMAEPGEFTKLAFLNGRMDLEQAEAVIDVIQAKSSLPLGVAERQLQGRLGEEIRSIRQELLDLLAQMTVNIDFPDEDIEQRENDRFHQDLSEILMPIQRLLDTSENGRIIRDGIRLAIIGRPNVGKSSLLNALLGEQRAIVTDIPGTTRDTIEESATIGGIPLILTDTAGIRETEDVIEKMGIERSQEELEHADLVVLVIDGSTILDPEDVHLIEQIRHRRSLIVLNKEDLGTELEERQLREIAPDVPVVRTSLRTMQGADVVIDRMQELFLSGIQAMSQRNIITNERHRDALARAREAIELAMHLIESGEPIEICEIEAHAAYDALGEIIGETAVDEILDTVFSRFCLGK